VIPTRVTYESTQSFAGQLHGKLPPVSTNIRIGRIVSYTVLVLSNKSSCEFFPGLLLCGCDYALTCLTYLQFDIIYRSTTTICDFFKVRMEFSNSSVEVEEFNGKVSK
jgi:hypothetical protein